MTPALLSLLSSSSHTHHTHTLHTHMLYTQSLCGFYSLALSHIVSCAPVPPRGTHGGAEVDPPTLSPVPSHHPPLPPQPPCAAVRGHTCIKRGKSVRSVGRHTHRETAGASEREEPGRKPTEQLQQRPSRRSGPRTLVVHDGGQRQEGREAGSDRGY